MSGTSPDPDVIKKDVITALTGPKKPIIIESCLDVMLSQIKKPQDPKSAFEDLVSMFEGYFKRERHDPLTSDPDLRRYFDWFCPSQNSVSSNITDSTSSKKSQVKETEVRYQYRDDLRCCLPCSCITLAGNRAIKDLGSTSGQLIKNMEYADAFWDWFIERTDIDKIAGKILSDLEFGGKFPVPYDSIVGLISQVMINEINKGMSSRRKQRTAKSLKTIGMRMDNDYSGLKISDMQVAPGMILGLQLVAKIEDYYNYRRVVQTIEAIANQKISQQTIASIRATIELLRRSSEKFRYGTNAHNTLNSIAWKLAEFWLVVATSKATGLNQERLDDIVDGARNMLLLNRIGTPADKGKTRIYIDCANDFRDLILGILSKDEAYWKFDDNLRTFLDIEENLVERFIASFKEATGINLTDKKWLKEDAVVSHDLPNRL